MKYLLRPANRRNIRESEIKTKDRIWSLLLTSLKNPKLNDHAGQEVNVACLQMQTAADRQCGMGPTLQCPVHHPESVQGPKLHSGMLARGLRMT